MPWPVVAVSLGEMALFGLVIWDEGPSSESLMTDDRRPTVVAPPSQPLSLLFALPEGPVLVEDEVDRVLGLVAHPHFVVQVGAGGPAGVPHERDHVAALHGLARLDVEAREVPVARDHAVAVVDHERVAVPALHSGRDHDPVRRRLHLRPDRRRDVYAGVEVLLGGEGV